MIVSEIIRALLSILGPLVVVVLVLTIITLVGHGLWVALRAVVCAIAGRGRAKRPVRGCVFCGRTSPRDSSRCQWCGRDLEGPLARELADLDALTRQLKRLGRRGLVDQDEAARLIARAQRHRMMLIRAEAPSTPASASRPAPAPEGPPAGAAPSAAIERMGPGEAPHPEEPVEAILVEPRGREAPVEREAAQAEQAAPIEREAALADQESPAAGRPGAAAEQPPGPPASPAPRRSWGELVAAFMEERNIRWGELIGGLLIVGSSIALVLSLWDTLREIRYFPFLIFVAATAALFFVGLYAHHRWRLASTSRGVLMIAGLLVPLNFLALAALSARQWTWLTLAMEAGALGLFAWLGTLAGRVLMPGKARFGVLAVAGPSAALAVGAHAIGPESGLWWYLLIACVPAGCLLGAVAGWLKGLSAVERERLDASQVAALATLVAGGAFAAAVAWGLLVARSGGLLLGLNWISPLVVLGAAGALGAGLAMRRGTAHDTQLAGWHLAGTSTVLGSTAVMLAALALAWPQPAVLLAVGLLVAAVLATAGLKWHMPALSGPALGAAVVAVLVAFHLIWQRLPWLVEPGSGFGYVLARDLLESASAAVLAGMFLVVCAAAELLVRRSRRAEAAVYAGGGQVIALLALSLASWHGLSGSPNEAACALVVFAACGLGTLGLAARWRRAELLYGALALLAVAPLWELWRRSPRIDTAWAAVLSGQALLMALVAVGLELLERLRARSIEGTGVPSAGAPSPAWRLSEPVPAEGPLARFLRVGTAQTAEVLACAALGLGVLTGWLDRAALDRAPAPVVAGGLLVGAWLVLAWGYRSPVRTWTASLVGLATLLHTLGINYADTVALPWAAALLAHASAAALTAVAVDQAAARRAGFANAATWAAVFVRPLMQGALLSSALVLPVLVLAPLAGIGQAATVFLWLGVLWLAMAWATGSAPMFALQQAALTLCVISSTATWARKHGWLASVGAEWWQPQHLQWQLVALGTLSLGWLVVRILSLRLVPRLLAEDEHASAEPKPAPAWAAFPDGLPEDRLCSWSNWQHLLALRPSVDWCVRHATVWCCLLLAGGLLVPSVAEELLPGLALPAWARGVQQQACAPGAWLGAGVLAAMVLVALWDRWSKAEVAAGVGVLGALCALTAAHQSASLAAASTWRWMLGAGLLAACAVCWVRGPLAEKLRRAGARGEAGSAGAGVFWWSGFCVLALPVLVLTLLGALLAVWLQKQGMDFGGPAAGSLFGRMGLVASYEIPLLLILVAMVGQAWRERSAGVAFGAGLVLQLSVACAYVLIAFSTGRQLGVESVVELLQLWTITAALWAGVWLGVRRLVPIWREAGPHDAGPRDGVYEEEQPGIEAANRRARRLMRAQLGMAGGGFALLLGVALVQLILSPARSGVWMLATGGWPSWLGLGLLVAATVWRRVQLARPLDPGMAGLVGMAAIGLLACTLPALPAPLNLGPQWGYRVLMLGWAAYAWLIVLATWWAAALRTQPDALGPPQALLRSASLWVKLSGIPAVVLGLKAALIHVPLFDAAWEELLWAAAAVALASAAGATMAVWRRKESWALPAAWGVNLAASLVVWYFHRGAASFDEWWLWLVEANVIASAGVALVWLAARRRLYTLGELRLGSSPLLAVQIALPVAGSLALAAVVVGALMLEPERLPESLAQLGTLPGFSGLVLAALAAGWYVAQVAPRQSAHVFGAAVGAAAALAACSAQVHSAPAASEWLAYHSLAVALSAGCLAVVVLGCANEKLRLGASGANGGSGPEALAEAPDSAAPAHPTGWWSAMRVGLPRLEPELIHRWAVVLGTLAVLVAFAHVAPDHARAWWPVAAVLGVALSMALVAFWSREGIFVFISGLLVDAAAILAWRIWQTPSVVGLVRANALGLAAASVAWSLVAWLPRVRVPGLPLGAGTDLRTPLHGTQRTVGFAPLAAQLAVWLAAVLAVAGIAGDLWGAWPGWLRVSAVERLDWIVLAAAGAALGLLLWDAGARRPLAGVYVLVLVADGIWLRWRSYPAPWTYIWAPVNELAAVMLLAALAGWLRRWAGPLRRVLRIPDRPAGWATGWFTPAQALLATALGAHVLWIAVDFRFNGCGQGLPLILFIGRGHATTAALMLLGGAIVMAWQYAGIRRRTWQYAAFALGLVFTSSIGLANLDAAPGTPSAALPWLHRSAIIMLSATMLTMLAAFGLRLVFSRQNDWLRAGRRASPITGCLALLALGATLVQELWAFRLQGDVPMAGWAVVIVAAALAGLVVVCLLFALFARWDPLRLSDRGRTAYVYAAEALAAVVGLHLWLAEPWLFELGIFERWWMLWVMGGAFAGAGLAELFRRRRLPVLAEPLARTALALPLVPAVGCWFVEPAAGLLGVTGHTPLVWFVIALFYGMMAAVRRSLWMSAAALLSGNMGLWVFWQRRDLDFVDHPQLWLIPPAVAVLVAELLDRRRLNENQRTAVRYVTLGVIYLSSMTESWRGLAAAPWLPLVTILLAVAGVVLGILLRIRAFLYLGFACLVVIISRLIYFAAIQQGHMWVLWSCCMLLGAAILALFALFEKRRNDIQAALERLKRWEK